MLSVLSRVVHLPAQKQSDTAIFVRYPYPFDMADPVGEVEAILRERISQAE